MKEQDCDKNKGIPRKKGNSLFYKMIMSRKFLGIFFGVQGTAHLCGLAASIIGKTKCERYKKRNAIIRV